MKKNTNTNTENKTVEYVEIKNTIKDSTPRLTVIEIIATINRYAVEHADNAAVALEIAKILVNREKSGNAVYKVTHNKNAEKVIENITAAESESASLAAALAEMPENTPAAALAAITAAATAAAERAKKAREKAGNAAAVAADILNSAPPEMVSEIKDGIFKLTAEFAPLVNDIRVIKEK